MPSLVPMQLFLPEGSGSHLPLCTLMCMLSLPQNIATWGSASRPMETSAGTWGRAYRENVMRSKILWETAAYLKRSCNGIKIFIWGKERNYDARIIMEFLVFYFSLQHFQFGSEVWKWKTKIARENMNYFWSVLVWGIVYGGQKAHLWHDCSRFSVGLHPCVMICTSACSSFNSLPTRKKGFVQILLREEVQTNRWMSALYCQMS